MIDPEFENISLEDKGSKIYRNLKISWECKTEKDFGGFEEINICDFEVKNIGYKTQVYHGNISISLEDLNGDGFDEIIISKPPFHGNWHSVDVIDGKTNKLVFSDSYYGFSPIVFYKNKKGTFFISSIVHYCESKKVY